MSRKKVLLILFGIAFGAFVLVCILNAIIPPHFDVFECFLPWGQIILDYGTGSLYEKGYIDVIYGTIHAAEYPPLAMLLCAAVVWFGNVTGASEQVVYFIFRLAPALILLASTYVFFSAAKHFKMSDKKALILTAVFAFSFAFLSDIVWGQLDLFTVFFVLLALLMMFKKKYFLTILACIIGIQFKLQFLFALPVIAAALCHRMYKAKQLPRLFAYGAIAYALWFLLYIPFIYKDFDIFSVFQGTLTHYRVFAFKAMNLFTALGLNLTLLPAWYSIINFILLFICITLPAAFYFKKKDDLNVLMMITLAFTATFMLTTNMHERYMLPVIGTMLIAAHIIKTKHMLIANYFFYTVQFVNIIFALAWQYPGFIGESLSWGTNGAAVSIIAMILSWLSVIAFILLVRESYKYARTNSL